MDSGLLHRKWEVDVTQREMIRVRLRFIDLIKSFFLEPPDAERLSRWRGTFNALAGQQVAPLLDQAVQHIKNRLVTDRLKQLQQEYDILFVDPGSTSPLSLSAADHLDGKTYADTLLAVRRFFANAGIERYGSVSAREDALVLLLDILATLIQNEKEGSGTKPLQAQLVIEFLVPFVEQLEAAARTNDTAAFYRDCISLTRGYLELERQLLA